MLLHFTFIKECSKLMVNSPKRANVRRQIQHRRLLELILDLGVLETYCFGGYKKRSFVLACSEETWYSYTLVHFKVIY